MYIRISEIDNTENKVKQINFSEIFEEFNKEVPVSANLKLEIIGSLIKISGQINAKLNLICDLCLKEFTKEFNIEVEEFFSQDSSFCSNTGEFEIKQDCFIEDLNGKDEINISDFSKLILYLL